MLGERFTSTPGSSDYFVGGFITYTNEMKVELLGVTPEILAEFGAVSKETAEAMAAGARRRTGSTYALSITGVAGPDGGGEESAGRHGVRGAGRCRRDAGGSPAVHRRPPAHPRVHHADGAGCAEKANRSPGIAPHLDMRAARRPHRRIGGAEQREHGRSQAAARCVMPESLPTYSRARASQQASS